MNTIAQMWQEFQYQAYMLELQKHKDTALEYRMLFYSGFQACLSCMAELAETDLDIKGKCAVVESYDLEFKRMAKEYLQARQRGQ